MTEKFKYLDLLETEAISVSDDECYYFNEYGTVEKICDLLNNLSKENLILKGRIQEYEEIISDYKKELRQEQKDTHEQSNTIQQLIKENNELKKDIEQIHIFLDNAILTERTRLGKMSLKQFKEALK